MNWAGKLQGKQIRQVGKLGVGELEGTLPKISSPLFWKKGVKFFDLGWVGTNFAARVGSAIFGLGLALENFH